MMYECYSMACYGMAVLSGDALYNACLNNTVLFATDDEAEAVEYLKDIGGGVLCHFNPSEDEFTKAEIVQP